jgi:hypothetical protein
VQNRGADSVAYGYHAEVSAEGKTLNLIPTRINDNFTLYDRTGEPFIVYSAVDAIYEKTSSPLKKGDVKAGPILFSVDSRLLNSGTAALWKLRFFDYLNKEYETSFQYRPDQYVAPRYFPGSGGNAPKK